MLTTIARKARTARRIAVATMRARPVILGYHRVAHVEHDPWHLAVTPEDFDGHLRVLREAGRPVLPLDELHRRTVDGTAPRGAVAITFDDGYVDNLTTAAPLLERHGVHATVYVVTGSIGTDGPMWWDRLTEIVNADTGEVDRLWDILSPMPPDERDAELDRIAGDLGVDPAPTDRTRMMSADEVAALDALDHVTVGSHTVNHPRLTLADQPTRRRELTESKTALQDLLGRPVDLLAYPNGAADEAIADTARQAGYRLAVTTNGGVLRANDDPLLLPRLPVEDWSPDRFARVIRSFG